MYYLPTDANNPRAERFTDGRKIVYLENIGVDLKLLFTFMAEHYQKTETGYQPNWFYVQVSDEERGLLDLIFNDGEWGVIRVRPGQVPFIQADPMFSKDGHAGISNRQAATVMGQKGGRSTSERKRAAAQENGKRGGRSRKTTV